MRLINSIRGKLSCSVDKESKISIGDFLMSSGPLYISAINGGRVLIGNRVYFNHNCSITALKSVTIGNMSMFGNNVVIVDHNHVNHADNANEFTSKSVMIGSSVWIGANCTILAGSEIGDGSIVAAGSVVNGRVGSGELWGGCPARKIKNI